MTSHTRCFVLVQTAANMAPPRKKRAKAWLYFTRKDDNIATCNSCQVSISSKGGTTTNMQKHLATHASESPATGGGASPATGGGGGCIAGNRGVVHRRQPGGGCIAGNRGGGVHRRQPGGPPRAVC